MIKQSIDTVVHCSECGNETHVSFAYCLEHGWQECCDSTMSIASTTADIVEACKATIEKIASDHYLTRLYLPLDARLLQNILSSMDALPYCPMQLDCSAMSNQPKQCPNFEPCFYNVREEHRLIRLD